MHHGRTKTTGDNEQGTPQENAEDDENASNEDKATNPPTEQENGENGANTEPDKATEERAGGQGHHSAGKNEGDSHLRRFTQYQTFGSVGQ